MKIIKRRIHNKLDFNQEKQTELGKKLSTIDNLQTINYFKKQKIKTELKSWSVV